MTARSLIRLSESSSPSGSWSPSASGLPSTRDSTRRYSLGHPERLCCKVSTVHQGTGQGPDPSPRRSHLPWPACPLSPKQQRCQGSLPSAPLSFCLLFLSQLSHSAAPRRPALPSPGPQGPIKASGQRPAPTCCILSAHLKTPTPPGLATIKRGRPRAYWLPEAPRTQKGRRQRHFLGWQVLVSDSTRSTGSQRKAGVGFLGRRAAQTRRTEPLRAEGGAAGTPSPGGRQVSE